MAILDVKLLIGSMQYNRDLGHEIFTPNKSDSAGGFDVHISMKNNGEKAIKYAVFNCVPYNRVGDIVASEITGSPEARLKFTGPLCAGGATSAQWGNVWYNYTITKAVIQSVEIQYMDGTEVTIPASELGEKKGCYVATSVYGSYNCPEVWTLRRFRDFTLAETWYGRSFIHIYYAISPTLVKWFGNTNWFKKIWKTVLDKMVSNLNNKGFKDTPYDDFKW